MIAADQPFEIRLARDDADLRAAQRLRYRVFIEELGGSGEMVDHDARLERDMFDPVCDHLILIESTRPAPDHVVGAYRLLRGDRMAEIGRFYSESEFDLGPLRASGRRLLELGRSCLDPACRGGMGMYHLWQGLGDYIRAHEIEVLFGAASFPGTDLAALAQPLSMLHHHYLAPETLRPRAQPAHFQPMDILPVSALNRVQAMRDMPALIKAYLRLGGLVGEGAFVDHAFNTIDVCLVLDTASMNERQSALYTRARPVS